MLHIVLTTLLTPVAIGSGVLALLAAFAQGMSSGPCDDFGFRVARRSLFVFVACVAAIIALNWG